MPTDFFTIQKGDTQLLRLMHNHETSFYSVYRTKRLSMYNFFYTVLLYTKSTACTYVLMATTRTSWFVTTITIVLHYI